MFDNIVINVDSMFFVLPFVNLNALQEILAFFTRNFGQKKPPYSLFAPMFNLTKMAWQVDLDPTFLTKYF